MFVMDYQSSLNSLNAEINDLLHGSEDTIYFDSEGNVFQFTCEGGSKVGMTLDRLIDIL